MSFGRLNKFAVDKSLLRFREMPSLETCLIQPIMDKPNGYMSSDSPLSQVGSVDSMVDENQKQNVIKDKKAAPKEVDFEKSRASEAPVDLTVKMSVLRQIELEFERFQAQFLQDERDRLDHEMEQVRNGTHPELMKLESELEQKQARELQMLACHFEFEKRNHEMLYQCQLGQIHAAFVNNKRQLQQRLSTKVSDWMHFRPKRHYPTDTQELKRKRLKRFEYQYKLAGYNHYGMPCAQVLPLEPDEILNDLDILGIEPPPDLQKTKKSHAPHRRHSTENFVVSKDAIIVDGKVYRCNETAMLFDSGQAFVIKIGAIGPDDIVVSRQDGSRTRLPHAFLLDGRVRLGPKPL
ncbi:hypothetical protein EDD86DRAFT_203452 [Gorgonomyces haynaldii]|nr:hypothetical protein EDD86DRAFT_203452 [Gorgonomyces haynaldii]